MKSYRLLSMKRQEKSPRSRWEERPTRMLTALLSQSEGLALGAHRCRRGRRVEGMLARLCDRTPCHGAGRLYAVKTLNFMCCVF